MSGRLAYTYSAAADATGISVRTLKRAVQSGELKTLNPRVTANMPLRRTLIAPTELERWLQGRTR